MHTLPFSVESGKAVIVIDPGRVIIKINMLILIITRPWSLTILKHSHFVLFIGGGRPNYQN